MAEVDFTQLTQEELDALLEGPAMPPPEGEVSIFDDPPNQNGLAIGVFTACTAVVVICLAIRLYAQFGLMRRAQVQEYLLVAAFVRNYSTPRSIRCETDRLGVLHRLDCYYGVSHRQPGVFRPHMERHAWGDGPDGLCESTLVFYHHVPGQIDLTHLT